MQGIICCINDSFIFHLYQIKMIQYKDTKYSVSIDGNVTNTKTGRVLKPQLNPTGYQHVCICIDSIRASTYIHRMVALCYIGEPNGLTVNHKDFNKLNNHVSNLEYKTHQENMQHATINGRLERKLNESKVKEIRQLYSQGNSLRKLAKLYDVSHVNISNVVKGKFYKRVK